MSLRGAAAAGMLVREAVFVCLAAVLTNTVVAGPNRWMSAWCTVWLGTIGLSYALVRGEERFGAAHTRAQMHWTSVLVFGSVTVCDDARNEYVRRVFACTLAMWCATSSLCCLLTRPAVIDTCMLAPPPSPPRGRQAVQRGDEDDDDDDDDDDVSVQLALGIGSTFVCAPLLAAWSAVLAAHALGYQVRRPVTGDDVTLAAVTAITTADGVRGPLAAMLSRQWHWRHVTKRLHSSRRKAAAVAALFNIGMITMCALGAYVGALVRIDYTAVS